MFEMIRLVPTLGKPATDGNGQVIRDESGAVQMVPDLSLNAFEHDANRKLVLTTTAGLAGRTRPRHRHNTCNSLFSKHLRQYRRPTVDSDEIVADKRDNDSSKPAEASPRPKPIVRIAGKKLNTRSDAAKRAITFGTAAATIGGLGAAVSPRGSQPEAPAPAPEPVALNETERPSVLNVSSTWDIEQTKNEQVDFFIDFLQWRNRDKTKLWLERLGKYGPMIQAKLAERGMPQDLIWLATIESGMNPNAYSKAAAAGLWQFIEETGERHGLEVNQYVDERRDPIKSTDAALDYLTKLNKRFGGSWYLTAAGYNTGENRVERIVKERAGGRMGDESVFWQIDNHLPAETRDYVPLMLAMGHIGKDPHKYGFTDLKLQAPFAYDEVKVPGGVPLARVAKAVGVEAAVVYDLNPHLLQKMTPPNREWSVRIPKNTASQFAANWDAQAAPASADKATE